MADAPQRPTVTFSSFIASLGGSAMEHLGFASHPGAGPKNLVLARQTIDLLSLLKDKTAGNLDHEEEQLLDAVLYELRTKWVEASKTD